MISCQQNNIMLVGSYVFSHASLEHFSQQIGQVDRLAIDRLEVIDRRQLTD